MIGLDGVTGAQGLRKAEAIPVVVATLHGSNQADFVFFYTKERERRGGEIRGREGGGGEEMEGVSRSRAWFFKGLIN